MNWTDQLRMECAKCGVSRMHTAFLAAPFPQLPRVMVICNTCESEDPPARGVVLSAVTVSVLIARTKALAVFP